MDTVQYAGGPTVGIMQIDDKAATSIRYERMEKDGQSAYNLSFMMDNKTVAKLKGLDDIDLENAVGDRNAKAIREAEADKGTLKGSALANEYGLSPEENARRIAEKEERKQAGFGLSEEMKALLAQRRADDNKAARELLGLNVIEPEAERGPAHLPNAEETKRATWLAKADEKERAPGGSNQVESDEVFTATNSDTRLIVPPEIEKQYIRRGVKFYHPKNTELVAFEDKGNRLETRSNSEYIAEAMVKIAESRGWDEIKVSGTETFRREVWLEAAARGMHVNGYTPTEQDKVQLESRIRSSAANTVSEGKDFREREKSQDRDKTMIAGELLAHGPAKYLHDENNQDSYFVSTRNERGEVVTSWGVDLSRAVEESGAKPGDQISIKNEGRKPVTVMEPVRDKEGRVIGSQQKETHRNSWNVQLAETFRTQSAELGVKNHPELAGAYAAAFAIDQKAKADGLSPEQRAIVTARVQQNIVNSIERGELPEVKIVEQRNREIAHNRNKEMEYDR